MAAQSITWNVPDPKQNAEHRFCALGMRSRRRDLSCPECYTVMLVLLDPHGRLRVLVHPEIRNLYHGEELEYIDAIVWDFIERGKMDPETLISHLSSVGGVGPLVPTHTGDVHKDAPLLSRLVADLTEL